MSQRARLESVHDKIEYGEVTERPKVHASKACEGVTPPRVRISASPPEYKSPQAKLVGFCILREASKRARAKMPELH